MNLIRALVDFGRPPSEVNVTVVRDLRAFLERAAAGRGGFNHQLQDARCVKVADRVTCQVGPHENGRGGGRAALGGIRSRSESWTPSCNESTAAMTPESERRDDPTDE